MQAAGGKYFISAVLPWMGTRTMALRCGGATRQTASKAPEHWQGFWQLGQNKSLEITLGAIHSLGTCTAIGRCPDEVAKYSQTTLREW